MPFIRAGDITVHYSLTGPDSAPVLMFANSLGTNFHVWDPQARALETRYRVLRYDMRGHGLTDAPPPGENGYGMGQLADDALGLLDTLELDRIAFCGLSIGGMVGQVVAARAPDRVTALVLCDTAPRIGPPQSWTDRVAAIRRGGLDSIADAVLQRWFTAAFLTERPAEARGFRNMLARTPADGYIGGCLAIRGTELGAATATIACPTLVVAGEEDLATPPAAAREMAATIKGARLEILPRAAHIPTVEQPEALNRLLAGFLDGHKA